MIMIDNATAVVFTPAELSSAISANNGIDYVYLGDNITMTSGIRIHPAKPSLIIDGHYPPESTNFHTLSDTGSDTGQIYINAASNIDLTFQNLIIAGRNYYGMPRVYDVSGTENVKVTYQNVTYVGPQMTWHVRGLTRYIDCDVTITGQPSSGVQEVGEVCKVEIGGITTMRKTNTDHGVFWFYGDSTRRSSLKILAGANVTITTAHYFMYEYYPPEYIIEPGASFTLNTNSGISWDSGHTAASFLVGENASFRYTQTINRASYATLYLDGALTVGEGASVYMQANFVNTGPMLRFTSGSAGLYINNPKSFVLYNRGTVTAATAFSFAASIPITLTGGQLNFWRDATLFPTAGTFDDIPLHKWNRPDWSPFTLRGTAGASQTNIAFNDFTPEELAPLPGLLDLQLHMARVFSIGNLPLLVNPVAADQRPITGMTEINANVRAVYTAGGTLQSPGTIADESGLFFITVPVPVPFAASVIVSSNTPFLITSVPMTARDDGELTIKSSPDVIRFQIRPFVTEPDVLLPRQPPDDPVIVSDTRIEKTKWRLWAKITGPLKTVENDILDDAVVFASEDGSLITLGTDSVPVHTDGPYPVDETPVTWAPDRGVLARITVPVRSGKEYSTQLIWEVYPLDVQPDGRASPLTPISNHIQYKSDDAGIRKNESFFMGHYS